MLCDCVHDWDVYYERGRKPEESAISMKLRGAKVTTGDVHRDVGIKYGVFKCNARLR